MTEQIVIENDSAVFHFGKFWAMEKCHIVLNLIYQTMQKVELTLPFLITIYSALRVWNKASKIPI